MIHYNAKVKALPHLLLPFIHPHAYGPYVQAIPMRVEKNKNAGVYEKLQGQKKQKVDMPHLHDDRTTTLLATI